MVLELHIELFFALGEWMSTSDGIPTNAIYGVTRMLLKLLKTYVKKR